MGKPNGAAQAVALILLVAQRQAERDAAAAELDEEGGD